MRITIAKDSGFCLGVKNTLRKLEEIEKDAGQAYILGDIIHNTQVVEKINSQGFTTVESLGQVRGPLLVISAHGVPKEVIKEARAKGLKIINTTCPLVRNVHSIVSQFAREGFDIIVFGDPDHPEVKGINGQVSGACTISDIPSLLSLIDDSKQYAIVFQTTQDTDMLDEVRSALKGRKNVIIKDTICMATKSRQQSARLLAREVDIMIVIGGKKSANTRRLYNICSRSVETRHIESAEELEPSWFSGKSHVGITAGASTPDWIIKGVSKRIEDGF